MKNLYLIIMVLMWCFCNDCKGEKQWNPRTVRTHQLKHGITDPDFHQMMRKKVYMN